MKEKLYILKGMISEMPEEDQKYIYKCCDELRDIVSSYENGSIALAIVGLEKACE